MHTRRNELVPFILLITVAAFGAARSARAQSCSNVMLVIDRSGSMADTPAGGGAGPSKWSLVQAAIDGIDKYKGNIRFGLELFSSPGGSDAVCYSDTSIVVPPSGGTTASIISKVKAATPTNASNIGDAIKRAAAEPSLRDGSRPQYIVLITDGDPNCHSGDQNGGKYTIDQIKAAAAQVPSIHTMVIAFDTKAGNVDIQNAMAQAGKEPAPGCQGNAASPCYYLATDDKTMTQALDKALAVASRECDCLKTGCSVGQVCDAVDGIFSCVADDCIVVNCPQGAYCKRGQCLAVCPPCLTGQRCQAGACVVDPCAGVTCGMGQVCTSQGRCVDDPCAGRTCSAPLVCDRSTGACADDPCRLVKCPTGATCRAGFCEALPVVDMASPPDLMTAEMAPNSGGGKGCHAAPGRSATKELPIALAFAALALLVAAMRSRRRN